MRSKNKEKAQSILLGFVLLIGIISIGYYVYIIETVPIEKQQDEIKHFGEVSSDLIQFRDKIVQSGETGQQQSQPIKMGTQYTTTFPTPPDVDPPGRLSVEKYSNRVKIYNASGSGGASNYWTGNTKPCERPVHCYEDSYIKYKANYQFYNSNPTTYYENTILYDNYSDKNRQIQKTQQSIINGRNIEITTIEGNIDTSSSETLNTQIVPVSAPSQEIQVTGEDGPVEIEIPTRIPIDKWRNDILNDQYSTASSDGFINKIEEVDGKENVIRIEMIQDETYTLEISKVYLTTQNNRQPVPNQNPAYVAWQGNENIEIQESSTERIPTQVRDKYNNPISGVPVEAYARDQNGECIGEFQSAESQGCSNNAFQPGGKQSGDNGEAVFFYESPEVSADKRISIRISLGTGVSTTSSYIPKKKAIQN